MKISELNETLSFIANIGVVVGIVFLILEINQNTRAIENDAFWSRVNSAQLLNSLVVENEEVAELGVKYFLDPTVMENPGSPERMRIQLYLAMITTQTEARFVTESDDLESLRASIIRYLRAPGMRAAFRERMELFTPEFADYIQDLMQETENLE